MSVDREEVQELGLGPQMEGISKEDSEGIAIEQKNQGRSYAVGISQRNE